MPESLDGVVKVRYWKSGDKYVPEDITIKFEVFPQGAVDYIVKNWKEVLTAKAIYASSTKAGIGDFVTMNIKDVVGGEDNIIVVTIDANSLDDSFFSADIPVAANLRLSVKMNGSESISSDYLPLSSLLSYDQIIEYTTVTGEPVDYKYFFEIQRYYSPGISLTDSHTGDTWRILIEACPSEDNLFSCIFNIKAYDLQYNVDPNLYSLSFVTPIEVRLLSFYGCRTLVKVDISNVNTENVTSMKSMFFGCRSLTDLDLSGFDTRNVTDMFRMFMHCASLTNLDLSSFDTKNVTKMWEMFFNCKSLTSLDLSGFDTKNVTSMYCMFNNCRALASLDLSSFDTKNVTDMGYMFNGCQSLASLDLSSFDTRNVASMRYMFNGCQSLTSLDLSSFDTRNVKYMDGMFDGCTNLKEIIMRGCDKETIEKISKVKPDGAVIITD